jgi:hypothetical protein
VGADAFQAILTPPSHPIRRRPGRPASASPPREGAGMLSRQEKQSIPQCASVPPPRFPGLVIIPFSRL